MMHHHDNAPPVNLVRITLPCGVHGKHFAFLGSNERDIAVAFALIIRQWHERNGHSCRLECITDDDPLLVSPFNEDSFIDDLPY